MPAVMSPLFFCVAAVAAAALAQAHPSARTSDQNSTGSGRASGRIVFGLSHHLGRAAPAPPPPVWGMNLTLSVPRSSLAAASAGNVLVFAGGLTAAGPSDVVDIFDFAATGGPPTHTVAKLSAPRVFDGGQNMGAALGEPPASIPLPSISVDSTPQTFPRGPCSNTDHLSHHLCTFVEAAEALTASWGAWPSPWQRAR